MDADLTSFLKGRRLAWARRESTMRVQLENVDENQQRLFSKPGVAKQKAGAKKIAKALNRTPGPITVKAHMHMLDVSLSTRGN